MVLCWKWLPVCEPLRRIANDVDASPLSVNVAMGMGWVAMGGGGGGMGMGDGVGTQLI